MNWSDVTRPPTRRVLRQFAGLLVVIPICLALVAAIRAGARPTWSGAALACGIGAVVLGLAGWVRPTWLRWPFTIAMLVAFPVGFVVSQLVLAILYYGMFLAIGLGLRASGRDTMVRKRRPHGTSYWEDKPQPRGPASYLRQY